MSTSNMNNGGHYTTSYFEAQRDFIARIAGYLRHQENTDEAKYHFRMALTIDPFVTGMRKVEDEAGQGKSSVEHPASEAEGKSEEKSRTLKIIQAHKDVILQNKLADKSALLAAWHSVEIDSPRHTQEEKKVHQMEKLHHETDMNDYRTAALNSAAL